MKMVGGIGPSTYLTVVIFCAGLVTGLIMTSFVSNHTSVSQHMMYPSIMKSSAGRELVELVRRYNKTLSLHARRLGGHTSHDHVHERDKLINQQTPIKFGDAAFHNEDDGLARQLSSTVRVLCWVMTMESNHATKTYAVRDTWTRHCNKALLMSDAYDSVLDTIKIDTEPGRKHLTAKTMKAFDYIYTYEMNKYDWFLKADDDTYVVLENLRFLLMNYSSDDPVYFGLHFDKRTKQGYTSGGAGYVISREALRRYGKRANGSCIDDEGAEDVQFGRCMETLGVRVGNSRDVLGRQRFNCFRPGSYFTGKFPSWYYKFAKYPPASGVANMSDFSISFHYMKPIQMYELEFFVYHFQRYGVQSGSTLWGSKEVPAKDVLRLLMWYALGDGFEAQRHLLNIV